MGVIESILPEIWLFIIAFFLLYYGVTDGYDLGIGILTFFTKDENRRTVMIASVAGTWHGNQTWLVLLGGMLFGAFPLFYSVLLSSLYVPIMIMLFGLIFRGVAIEFRSHGQNRAAWTLGIGFGSLVATLAQGFALGGLLTGLEIENGRFTGGLFDWLNLPGLLAAAGVLCGYVMLGANYLILKTDGPIQAWSRRWAWAAAVLTIVISIGVHAWILGHYGSVASKWRSWPEATALGVFALLTIFSVVMYFKSLAGFKHSAPLFWNAFIILFSFVIVSIGFYPYMIPNMISPSVSVQNAAAAPQTLKFMFVVMVIILPVILFYTGYKQWVFRAKTNESDYAGEDE